MAMQLRGLDPTLVEKNRTTGRVPVKDPEIDRTILNDPMVPTILTDLIDRTEAIATPIENLETNPIPV